MASDVRRRRADAPERRVSGAARHPSSSGLHPVFPCRGADLRSAMACEQAVFGRRYRNTPAELRAAYERYEDDTSFGAVLLPDGRAVGAVRLLHGGPASLKTLQDAADPPWSLPIESSRRAAGVERLVTWDVATFGVDATRFGGDRSVTLALLSVLFGAFRDNRVAAFVAVIDELARRPLAALGMQLTDLPGAWPAPYFGSASSVPVYAHVDALHRHHAARFPEVHPQVFHGRGIPGVDPAAAGAGRFTLPSERLSEHVGKPVTTARR